MGAVSDLGIDGEPETIGQPGEQQDPVKQRCVVGDDQHPVAGLPVMFQPGDLNPVQQPQQAAQEKFQETSHVTGLFYYVRRMEHRDFFATEGTEHTEIFMG